VGKILRSLLFSGLFCSAYAYNTQAYVHRAMMFVELSALGYITIRLINGSEQMNDMAPTRGEAWYSPACVRKLGRRR
jgi:hypothetical protein